MWSYMYGYHNGGGGRDRDMYMMANMLYTLTIVSIHLQSKSN